MQIELYKVRLDVATVAASAFADAIEPWLTTVGWDADEDDPTSVVVGFSEAPPDVEAMDRAVTEAARALGQPKPVLSVERIGPRDWLSENRDAFPPIREGRFFVYVPDWPGRVPAGSIGLKIPAAGAFGTGRHGSTQGCLAALAHLPRPQPGTILDVGCGSGILAIAAHKLWRRPIVGTDIDPQAVAGMTENARANGALPVTRTAVARGYRHRLLYGRSYPLIFANILAKPLTGITRDLARHLMPGGYAVLSGLLPEQGSWVAERHRALGLRLVRRIHRDGWLTLVLQAPYVRGPRSRISR